MRLTTDHCDGCTEQHAAERAGGTCPTCRAACPYCGDTGMVYRDWDRFNGDILEYGSDPLPCRCEAGRRHFNAVVGTDISLDRWPERRAAVLALL